MVQIPLPRLGVGLEPAFNPPGTADNWIAAPDFHLSKSTVPRRVNALLRSTSGCPGEGVVSAASASLKKIREERPPLRGRHGWSCLWRLLIALRFLGVLTKVGFIEGP